MPRNNKFNGLSVVIAIAALFTAMPASAFSVTAGGTAVSQQGLVSSVLDAVTMDFNSGLMPAEYVGGLVVTGNSAGNWASPPGDNSHYLTVGPASPAVISLGSLASYFGYYGGSPDSYNSLEFWNGATEVASFTGTQLAVAAGTSGNGNQQFGAYWNFTAANSDEWFDTVKMISTLPAFETDNHAVLFAVEELPLQTFSVLSPVPEPQTYAMMLAGLGLMGFMAHRRRKIS